MVEALLVSAADEAYMSHICAGSSPSSSGSSSSALQSLAVTIATNCLLGGILPLLLKQVDVGQYVAQYICCACMGAGQ